MTIEIKKAGAIVNRVLTTINGFFFGIFVQFSPLHSKGRAREIPLVVNIGLLLLLVTAFMAAILAR